MREIYLTRKHKTNGEQFIKLTIEGNKIYTEWGKVGGKVNTTDPTEYQGKDLGKVTERSPEVVAEEDFLRKIDKLHDEGYSEDGGAKEWATIDFNNLPRSFCPAKPVKQLKDEKKMAKIDALLRKKIQEGLLLAQLKENGMCHWLVIGDRVKIYTRRNEDHTRKYPTLVAAIEKMNLPKGTIIAFELCVDPLLGMPHLQAFNLVQGITKADVAKGELKEDLTHTMELQKATPIKGMVFNILYFNTEDLTLKTYKEAHELICKLFPPQESGALFFQPKIIEFKTLEEIDKWVEEHKGQYEGLVLWDLSQNTEIGFTGKPSRAGCWKRKNGEEMDVIAYGFEYGSGKNSQKVGTFLIGQLLPNGKIFEMGKATVANPKDKDPNDYKYPMVIKVSYANQFATGKLQFPQFLVRHEDKVIEECIFVAPEEE